jgi:hypothetical protein
MTLAPEDDCGDEEEGVGSLRHFCEGSAGKGGVAL